MSEPDFCRIGKKIKEKRMSLGYKQEYVAEILNVNPSHISNIECGRANPSLTLLIKIADILKCSVDYFINEEYSFTPETSDDLDERLLAVLKYMSRENKKKILKIIEIL